MRQNVVRNIPRKDYFIIAANKHVDITQFTGYILTHMGYFITCSKQH